MLSLAESVEEIVCLAAGHAAVRDRRIQLHACVPGADLPHRVGELAGVSGGAQRPRFVFGESTNFDHPVERAEDAIPFPPLQLLPDAAVHAA